MNVIIVGSGRIGCDLLAKIIKSKSLKCVAFIGRSKNSEGVAYALRRGVPTLSDGLVSLTQHIAKCDIVFDATSAGTHPELSRIAKNAAKRVINLTPHSSGVSCVPAINVHEVSNASNVNLISCGGQASIPIALAIAKSVHEKPKYIEVVSSISSDSAGSATRRNMDEYLTTTERAIKLFTKAEKVKAILNINPAIPGVFMQTTIYAVVDAPERSVLYANVREAVQAMREYVPGYELIVDPLIDREKITVAVRVAGAGDFLPRHAGNLDIITSAAIKVAEKMALSRAIS